MARKNTPIELRENEKEYLKRIAEVPKLGGYWFDMNDDLCWYGGFAQFTIDDIIAPDKKQMAIELRERCRKHWAIVNAIKPKPQVNIPELDIDL